MSRESPDQRRCRAENAALKTAIEESVKTHTGYIKSTTYSSLEELKSMLSSRSNHHNDWTYIIKNSYVICVLIKEMPLPKIICHIRINSELILSAFYMNTEVTTLKTGKKINPLLKLPMKVNNINDLEDLQHLMAAKFGPGNNTNGDNIMKLIDDCLANLATQQNDQQQAIQFIREQIALLTIPKSSRKYNWETTILCSLMYSISPHAYKFLRSLGILTLPCPSTIARLCGQFSTNPQYEQIDSNFFAIYSIQVQSII